jgi:GSCFA family
MTHELKRVLLGQKYENEGLIELKEGQWFDPHASGLKLLPHDVAIKNREALRDGMLTVKTAQAVFMTLGMTESWLDKNTGMVMNQNPWRCFLAKIRRSI